MLYIVEVTIDTERLHHQLNQMRTWLDHMKIEAVGFRQVPGAKVCWIDFNNEQEASAFARAFAGQTLVRAAA